MELQGFITNSLQAISASSLATWVGLRTRDKATKSALVDNFRREYGAEEMRNDLQNLRNFKTKEGPSFAQVFGERRHEMPEIDASRRRVSHYFQRVVVQERRLGRKAMRIAAPQDGVSLLLEIVEPLERAISAEYEESGFRRLGKLHGLQKHRTPIASPSPKELDG